MEGHDGQESSKRLSRKLRVVSTFQIIIPLPEIELYAQQLEVNFWKRISFNRLKEDNTEVPVDLFPNFSPEIVF